MSLPFMYNTYHQHFEILNHGYLLQHDDQTSVYKKCGLLQRQRTLLGTSRRSCCQYTPMNGQSEPPTEMNTQPFTQKKQITAGGQLTSEKWVRE